MLHKQFLCFEMSLRSCSGQSLIRAFALSMRLLWSSGFPQREHWSPVIQNRNTGLSLSFLFRAVSTSDRIYCVTGHIPLIQKNYQFSYMVIFLHDLHVCFWLQDRIYFVTAHNQLIQKNYLFPYMVIFLHNLHVFFWLQNFQNSLLNFVISRNVLY